MTWEYLAGFFDGEGCIFYNERNYGRRRYALVNVTQGSVNEEKSHICRQIHVFLRSANIPCRLNTYPGRNGAHGGCKVVVSNAPGIIAWLEGMLPYLKVKREDAILAIEFSKQTRPRVLDRRLAA